MSHKPIIIDNYSLVLPHKTCFKDFSTIIYSGSKIAIIGRNGSGKSSLLKIILDNFPVDINQAYVPQIIEDYQEYSGGQRFNKRLTEVLTTNPDILFLDEPTNHLDLKNRNSLLRMLQHFAGTLLVATHDTEILCKIVTTIWHIDNGYITVFSGNYNDYINEINAERKSLEQELSILDKRKKEAHQKLMKEQKRAKNSKERGAKNITARKWPTIVSKAKAIRSEETSGRKKSEISNKKQEIVEKLSEMRLPEKLEPKFLLKANDIYGKTIISITEGSVSYSNKVILSNINLSITGSEHIAITGDNGRGKSTIIKAILNDKTVTRAGNWHILPLHDIGYLDQHYNTFDPNKTILEIIQKAAPNWNLAEIRSHLNDFLFRKNDEVALEVNSLSGGEKCRLSLAVIAAINPKLLILDEITNNLDIETKEHVIEVLNCYSGAMIVISHDEVFLNNINIKNYYNVKEFI